MLKLNPFTEDQGRSMLPQSLAFISFLVRIGFSTITLAYMLDSLVRVSRRFGKNHFSKITLKSLKLTLHTSNVLSSKPEELHWTYLSREFHFAFGKGPNSIRFLRLKRTSFRKARRGTESRQSGAFQIMDFYRFLLNDFKSVDSLSKVLFIFPSQYFFAIGFPTIFSFRRSLSPI